VATVATTLKMFDSFTSPMKRITQSMNIMLRTMDQMESSVNRNVGADKLLAIAKRQLALAESEIASQIKESTRAQEKFNRSVKDGERSLAGMFDSIKGIAAAYLTFEGAKALFTNTIGKAMERQQLVDTIAARMGNADGALNVYERIRKQALAANADVNKSLSNVQAFMSNTMNPEHLEKLNMLSMRLSKLNPMEGIEGAAFSMKELLSGDYQSIVERFNIGRSLVQNSAALKAGKAGDVEKFIQGMDELLNQQQMTEDAFKRMLDSPASRWQRIINTFQDNMTQAGLMGMKAFLPVIDLINQGFDSGKFQSFFDGLAVGLKILADAAARTAKFISDHIDTIKSALVSAGVVLGGLIISWTAGWIAANWPIFAVIGAITGILYILNQMGVTSEQVLGYVTGAFYAAFAAINNMVMNFWNNVVMIAEFLVNVFNDPAYAIQKLFYDLVKNVVGYFDDMVNRIVDRINQVIQKINSVSTMSISLIPRLDDKFLDPLKPTSTKDVVDFSKYRLEFKDIGEQFNKGYNTGADFAKKMQETYDKMSVFSVPFGGAFDISKIAQVGEVGKIKDKVDISSEDLKAMRELAEMKNIQNFVTLQPQISFGDMHVRQEGKSIDEIIDALNTKMEEEIASSARGFLLI
jgi:hypothetical protein